MRRRRQSNKFTHRYHRTYQNTGTLQEKIHEQRTNTAQHLDTSCCSFASQVYSHFQCKWLHITKTHLHSCCSRDIWFKFTQLIWQDECYFNLWLASTLVNSLPCYLRCMYILHTLSYPLTYHADVFFARLLFVSIWLRLCLCLCVIISFLRLIWSRPVTGNTWDTCLSCCVIYSLSSVPRNDVSMMEKNITLCCNDTHDVTVHLNGKVNHSWPLVNTASGRNNSISPFFFSLCPWDLAFLSSFIIRTRCFADSTIAISIHS